MSNKEEEVKKPPLFPKWDKIDGNEQVKGGVKEEEEKK